MGRRIVEKLVNSQADVFAPRSSQFDLRKPVDVDRLFTYFRPQIVIHAAVTGGGIGFMQKNPGTICYDNLMMSTLLLEKSRLEPVEKFVGIGTVCSYPKVTLIPFREEDLWSGYPEETNAAYGLSKKMMLVQTQAYRQQFGFNGIHLLLVNLYGPGDNFSSESSHVIPALIKKFYDAVKNRQKEVTCWGNGSPTREFLYVEDAAEAVGLATEKYDKGDPINVGAGFDITIKDLATVIARFMGFDGKISWDPSKPSGQPRRCLDIFKAKTEFGFRAKTDLVTGLQATVDWYLSWKRTSGDITEVRIS